MITLRQVLWWAAVAFVLFYLFTQPVAAGHVVHNIFDAAKSGAASLVTFFNSI
jgi:hypothetical protein